MPEVAQKVPRTMHGQNHRERKDECGWILPAAFVAADVGLLRQSRGNLLLD